MFIIHLPLVPPHGVHAIPHVLLFTFTRFFKLVGGLSQFFNGLIHPNWRTILCIYSRSLCHESWWMSLSVRARLSLRLGPSCLLMLTVLPRIPGAYQEATAFTYGKERVALKRRKGFVKHCLRYGYRPLAHVMRFWYVCKADAHEKVNPSHLPALTAWLARALACPS